MLPKAKLRVKYILISTFLCLFGADFIMAQEYQLPEQLFGIKKRDPFVSLVDSKGNIKNFEQLFRPKAVALPTQIVVKGIFWAKSKPYAIINNKVVREGQTIEGIGVVLEKINPDNVVLNYRGETTTVFITKERQK